MTWVSRSNKKILGNIVDFEHKYQVILFRKNGGSVSHEHQKEVNVFKHLLVGKYQE